MKDPKLARYCVLPKIHKRVHNFPGRPVISNSGFNNENIFFIFGPSFIATSSSGKILYKTH